MRPNRLNEMLWQEMNLPTSQWGHGADAGARWDVVNSDIALEREVENRPDVLDAWLALADFWLAKGNYVRTVAVLTRAIEVHPDAGALFVRRAEALTWLDPAQSRRDANRATALGASLSPSEPVPQILAPASDEAVTTIYTDLSDIIEYLAVNTSMSGIQRVVANMLRCARDQSSPNARNLRPVLPDYHAKVVYAADPALVHELIDSVECRDPSRRHLDRLLLAISNSLHVIEPEPGSIFLMAGAFWITPNFDLLKDLRQKGVAITIFVHDLIQITNREYVEGAATIVFRRSLIDAGEIMSFFTTNSAFVAREVRNFLTHELELDTPVHAVPLATEMKLAPPEPWTNASLEAEFGADGYVLCVCTIEVRKNHIFLFHIWQQLIRSGRKNIPALVLVGKWGWEIAPFRELLASTNNLNGMIHVMNGITDAMLASLYRNCRFTIYPSFAEGWGLPIGESLVFGKPCIAAGVTSMPEVGGPLVRYIDPFDVETGLAAVTRLLDDPADLANWTQEVQAKFEPRSWSAFSEHLLGASRALAVTTKGQPAAFARLRAGEMAIVGSDAVEAAARAGTSMRTLRMARERGWGHVEDKGAWMTSPLATLRFIAVDCSPGEKLRVVIVLRGEKDRTNVAAQLRTTSDLTPYRDVAPEPTAFSVDAIVEEDGTVEVSISTRGQAIDIGRRVYAMLAAGGFHRHGHVDEALALMEAVRFAPSPFVALGEA